MGWEAIEIDLKDTFISRSVFLTRLENVKESTPKSDLYTPLVIPLLYSIHGDLRVSLAI